MRDAVLAIVEKHVGEGRPVGDGNYLTRCPFHKGGQESTPSFSINLEKALFTCFTCKVGGPISWLLHMLGVPRAQIKQELAGIQSELDVQLRLRDLERRAEWNYHDPIQADTVLPEGLLEPYLQCREKLPVDPTRLVRKGFSRDVLSSMQVGFDPSKSRVIYPVRDLYGNLAGMVGGSTQGTMPKYLVYQGGQDVPAAGTYRPADYGPHFDAEFPGYVFKKSKYLWNFDSVYPRIFFSQEVRALVLVEGFKAAMWLLQHGYTNTVALMTSKLSYMQKQQLMRLHARIVLFLDNDEPGQAGTRQILRDLRACMPWVVAVRYPKSSEFTNLQPDDLSAEVLDEVLSGAGVHKEQS
jgi:DNA primase